MCLAGQFVESEIGRKSIIQQAKLYAHGDFRASIQLPQSTATEYTWALIRLRKYAERLQPTD